MSFKILLKQRGKHFYFYVDTSKTIVYIQLETRFYLQL